MVMTSLAVVLLPSVVAWAPAYTSPLTRMPAPLRAVVSLKSNEADADEAVQPRLEAVGSVVEFSDGKRDSILGVIQSAEAKAKGGTHYSILDASNKLYNVPGRAIHVAFPSSNKKGEVTDILQDYLAVADSPPTELGVDPETLELAWELCSETDTSSHSITSILGVVDEKLVKTSVDKYKAFRLLTSDLGKIFFKPLNGIQYRCKTAKAVAASKDAWCRLSQPEDSWCFV